MMDEATAIETVRSAFTAAGFPPASVEREQRGAKGIMVHYPKSMGVSGTPRPARSILLPLAHKVGSSVGMVFDL